MPLKLKKSQTPSEPSQPKNESSGPWGRINPEPQSVVALRLCKKTSPSTEETHSYPYRVISSWHWRDGSEEELKIEAGSDLITVKGRGLDRLVEALDLSSLVVLCEPQFGSSTDTSDSILITSIDITPSEA